MTEPESVSDESVSDESVSGDQPDHSADSLTGGTLPGGALPGSVAILSDIHGNLEALTAVLAHIDSEGYEEIWCLGDIVGYGPEPIACTDLVRARARIVLMGNHDEALVKGAWGFNEVARGAMDWTRKTLKPSWLKPRSRKRWKFLETLPLRCEVGDWLLVHGSPRDPTSEYILPRDTHWPGSIRFDEIFEPVASICFVGHTHIPGRFTQEPLFTPQAQIEDPFRHEEGKWILNVGSVGQPRDGDWRACYLGYRAGDFRYHRVEYDVEQARRKIEAIPALDDRLGDRLVDGS